MTAGTPEEFIWDACPLWVLASNASFPLNCFQRPDLRWGHGKSRQELTEEGTGSLEGPRTSVNEEEWKRWECKLWTLAKLGHEMETPVLRRAPSPRLPIVIVGVPDSGSEASPSPLCTPRDSQPWWGHCGKHSFKIQGIQQLDSMQENWNTKEKKLE